MPSPRCPLGVRLCTVVLCTWTRIQKRVPSVLIFWGVTVQRPSPGFLIPCKRARETSRAYYLDERLSLFPHPLRFAVFLIIKAASPAEPLVIRTTFFYCQLWFLLLFFSSRKKREVLFFFQSDVASGLRRGSQDCHPERHSEWADAAYRRRM